MVHSSQISQISKNITGFNDPFKPNSDTVLIELEISANPFIQKASFTFNKKTTWTRVINFCHCHCPKSYHRNSLDPEVLEIFEECTAPQSPWLTPLPSQTPLRPVSPLDSLVNVSTTLDHLSQSRPSPLRPGPQLDPLVNVSSASNSGSLIQNTPEIILDDDYEQGLADFVNITSSQQASSKINKELVKFK